MAILLWKNAVTDRAQSDVERVLELLKKGWQSFTHEEKETWQNGLKGALNLSDLLRIQNNVSLLKEVLELDIEVFNLGKNLLKNTATSQTNNGVTFTVNDDGSVTADGTATGDAYYPIYGNTPMSIVNKTLLASGMLAQGYYDTYGMMINCYGEVSQNTYHVLSPGDVIIPGNLGYDRFECILYVKTGITVSNLVFKPMLRLASIEDGTYEPYSGRNLYVPTQEMYSELLGNVEAIRGAYCIHADTPPTPPAPLNTFQKWNDIEKILLDVYEILMNNFSYYCGGEIYAGDTSGLLL